MPRVLLAVVFVCLAALGFAQSMVKAMPFSFGTVQLLPSAFSNANKVCVDYMVKLDPDRLLHSFRINSGLKAKGEIYGGWESEGLAGHTLGHYLTACSQEYAVSHNATLKSKIDYIVSELKECQKNRPDGYISAIPNGDVAWTAIKSGDIHAAAFSLNGMWSPWYTHHKVLKGLIDAYHLTGNKDALVVATNFADWMIEETHRLDDGLWQEMLKCEYGGINEALADLFAITRKEKYLDLSKKFYDRKVLDPLVEGTDSVAGLHSNTQIPKIIGLARLYELTNSQNDLKAAKFFWYTVIKHHTYAIGGNSYAEYLGKPDKLSNRLSNTTCETCNTYNMLKLTRHLFMWDPRAEYFDYYERALLNDILASQDPVGGGVTYFMPLGSGTFREYSSPWDNFTCCHGSGMENHTKYEDSIYFHQGNQRLYVNLFIPSEITWLGQRVRQESNYPNDGNVTITIGKGSAQTYEMALRHPSWAKSTVQVLVNGKVAAISNKPSSYIMVKRTWNAGDKIQFSLPMNLRATAMPDNPKRVALMYGPLVLAADLAQRTDPKPRTPVLIGDEKSVLDSLVKDPQSLTFKTQSIGRPNELVFRPFWEIHQDRYAVYFDLKTDEEWVAEDHAYEAEIARKKDLEARTIDKVVFGEKRSEDAHKVAGQKMDVREASEQRMMRTVLTEGFCDFEMKADPSVPMQLVVTYWGNERLRPDFQILCNGNLLAVERLTDHPLNKFYEVTYNIQEDLVMQSKVLKLEFLASPNATGPSVAEIRVVKAPG